MIPLKQLTQKKRLIFVNKFCLQISGIQNHQYRELLLSTLKRACKSTAFIFQEYFYNVLRTIQLPYKTKFSGFGVLLRNEGLGNLQLLENTFQRSHAKSKWGRTSIEPLKTVNLRNNFFTRSCKTVVIISGIIRSTRNMPRFGSLCLPPSKISGPA